MNPLRELILAIMTALLLARSIRRYLETKDRMYFVPIVLSALALVLFLALLVYSIVSK